MPTRSLDISGKTWDTPVVVDTTSDAYFASLCDVGGHPAIAYFDMLQEDLRFSIRY